MKLCAVKSKQKQFSCLLKLEVVREKFRTFINTIFRINIGNIRLCKLGHITVPSDDHFLFSCSPELFSSVIG